MELSVCVNQSCEYYRALGLCESAIFILSVLSVLLSLKVV